MAETIIAKIQVRRGELEDLPVLDEGEFGYALDYNRLFIGNTPLEFVADGVTTRFTLQTKSIVPGQTKVLIDDSEQTQHVGYNFEDTDIVFTEAPIGGSVIKVSFNTELSVVNAKASRDRIVLDAQKENCDSINWNLLNYNSASIEYSLKNSAGAMNIGTLKVITNGTAASLIDLGGGIGDSGISFDARIDNGRVYVTYTNTSEFSANLFYSIQFWNTI